MSRLSSRSHDRGQGAASSSLFTDHPRHFMSDRKTNPNCSRHELDTFESTECCCFLPFRTPRRQPSIPRFAPQVPAEDTELQPTMLVSALTYPPKPTASRPTYQAKHIAHT